jgi:hypothetical protein
VLVGIAEEEAARLAPDLREALASLTHRRRIDNRQKFFNVVLNEGIEQRLIAVLQITHQAILAEGRGAAVESDLAAFTLIFEAADVRRQQAVQAEGVAFRLSKRGAFVKARIMQEIEARASSPRLGGGVLSLIVFLLIIVPL